MQDEETAFRSGFVTIVGETNVGKSTLLNRVLGEQVAAVSRKPQTTRNRILGVHHFHGGQVVFVDTPGLHDPVGELGRRMVGTARSTFADADAVLLVADATRAAGRWEEEVVRRARSTPILLALNKIDRLDRASLLPRIKAFGRLGSFVATHPISAKTGEGVPALVDTIVKRLPPGPPYFPEDMVSDVSEAFFSGEIVRSEIFERTGQELPYHVAVRVDSFEERSDRGDITIDATVLVARESQKGMVVGKGGHKIREIGTAARLVLAQRFGVPVHLKLRVQTAKRWTRDPRALDRLGYPSPSEES